MGMMASQTSASSRVGCPQATHDVDQMGVEVAAVRALDRSSRIVFGEKDGLHFPGFQRLQHAAQAGDAASVGLGEIHRFAGLRGGALRDPSIQHGAGVIANLFIRDAGNVG